jgi:hypothetical protein
VGETTKVQRYEPGVTTPSGMLMNATGGGRYVLATDYDALAAQRDALVAALEALGGYHAPGSVPRRLINKALAAARPQTVAAAFPEEGWFTKKPITIYACRWVPGRKVDGVLTTPEEFRAAGFSDGYPISDEEIRLNFHTGAGIKTLEGWHLVSEGDWIVTGIEGEKYPVKPGIFRATYDPARPQ